MDSRLSLLRENIKETGIQVFTVRVGMTTSTSQVFKNCATSADMYYNVTNFQDPTTYFNFIGEKTSRSRLSK
jgi:ABC-type transport system involved in Fe-S cluster assembly fused permease/ATPase subunit